MFLCISCPWINLSPWSLSQYSWRSFVPELADEEFDLKILLSSTQSFFAWLLDLLKDYWALNYFYSTHGCSQIKKSQQNQCLWGELKDLQLQRAVLDKMGKECLSWRKRLFFLRSMILQIFQLHGES